MTEITIINMESDCHLWTFNHDVGNTGVIRIELKSKFEKAFSEYFVLKKACNHGSIDSILAMHY